MGSWNSLAGSGIVVSSTVLATTGSAASNILITDDGKNVYILFETGIGMYARDAGAGLLTSLGLVAAGGGFAFCISADGLSVYVAVYGSTTIGMHILRRNVATGILTVIGTMPSQGSGPVDICISPDGLSVYGSLNSGGGVIRYDRDITTGLLTSVITYSCSYPYTICISPDGKNVYVAARIYSGTTDAFCVWDRDAVGALTLSTTYTTLYTQIKPCFSPDGRTMWLGTTTKMYTLSRSSTGALAVLATSIGAAQYYCGYVMSHNGTRLYILSVGVWITYSFDQTTRTKVNLLSNVVQSVAVTGTTLSGMCISPDDSSIYVLNTLTNPNVNEYQLSVNPGTVVLSGSSSYVAPMLGGQLRIACVGKTTTVLSGSSSYVAPMLGGQLRIACVSKTTTALKSYKQGLVLRAQRPATVVVARIKKMGFKVDSQIWKPI